jgi:peptidoglycan/xylan/chitin deacetylase (PgdA/CDA1 family)
MPTSRKRTKRRRKIRFPVLILGICLVCAVLLLITGLILRGCGKTEQEHPGSEAASKTPAAEQIQDSSDYSQFVGHKIRTSKECELFLVSADGMEPCGHVAAGALLDISGTKEGGYLEVSDSPFCIPGSAAERSDRWYRNDTNLVPYAEDLTTNDSFTLTDEDGNPVLTCDQSLTFPVYVKPGDGGRYGIRFMNGICYIDAASVNEVKAADRSTEPAAQEVPVLMYHFFYSEAEGGTRIDGNYVEVNELEEQLNYIQEQKFHACTMREILYWMEGRANLPEKSIAITIDDADPSVHQYAMPVFVKYGLHATNFVICGWQPAEMPYELWEMRENGMELQSHGFLTHTGGCSGMGHGGLLLCMDHVSGVEDVKRSFDYVDGGFVFCYPFGDINDNAESIVRDAGGKLAFTTEGGRIHPGMNPLALPRVRVTGGNGLSAFAASIG